jgi:hypothetical protein
MTNLQCGQGSSNSLNHRFAITFDKQNRIIGPNSDVMQTFYDCSVDYAISFLFKNLPIPLDDNSMQQLIETMLPQTSIVCYHTIDFKFYCI